MASYHQSKYSRTCNSLEWAILRTELKRAYLPPSYFNITPPSIRIRILQIRRIFKIRRILQIRWRILQIRWKIRMIFPIQIGIVPIWMQRPPIWIERPQRGWILPKLIEISPIWIGIYIWVVGCIRIVTMIWVMMIWLKMIWLKMPITWVKKPLCLSWIGCHQ